MRLLDTTQETATSWSPYKVETKQFLQDALYTSTIALFKASLGSNYLPNTAYVISGCVVSGSNVTAGSIFFNGTYYDASALTGATTLPITYNFLTTPDATADPTIFSDGTTHNIHNNVTVVAQNGSISGIFNTSTLVYLNKPNWITPTSELGTNFIIPATFTTYPNVFQYRKNNLNQLEFRGIVQCVSGAGATTLLTMPVGFRSVYFKQFPTYNATSGGFNTSNFDHTSYIVSISSIATNNYYSLDGVKISLDA